jgi:hypothetical protein
LIDARETEFGKVFIELAVTVVVDSITALYGEFSTETTSVIDHLIDLTILIIINGVADLDRCNAESPLTSQRPCTLGIRDAHQLGYLSCL